MYQHKNIRLFGINYVGKKIYFLTLCCHEGREYFRDTGNSSWIVGKLREVAALGNFAIHAYCVMPDHLHFLAEGLDARSDLLVFVKAFKIKISREFSMKKGQELWQKKYYDHILRRDESAESVCWYIWMNPVRAGLVCRPTDYPFAGSFTRKIPNVMVEDESWRPPYRVERRPPQKAAATRVAEHSSHG